MQALVCVAAVFGKAEKQFPGPPGVWEAVANFERLLNVDKEVDSECDQDKAVQMAVRAAGGIAKDVNDQMIGSTIRSPAERDAIVEDSVKGIMLIPFMLIP